MSELRSCPSKEALVTALYGEATPDERRALDHHLSACAACRDELQALGSLRATLQEWEAPSPPARLLVVSGPIDGRAASKDATVVAGPSRWWAARGLYGAGLAAAATLVLGLAAGLANLDITMGPQGLQVRTGRGQAAPATVSAPLGVEAAGRQAGVQPATASRPGGTPVAAAVEPTPEEWRAALVALEARLREEMVAQVAASAAGPRVALAGARERDEHWLRQVQEMIDASETRQQRNLAQRVTELAREFDVQRRTDLVSIQQGLGQLEGRTQAEVARTRELMNLIVRTSGGAPQR